MSMELLTLNLRRAGGGEGVNSLKITTECFRKAFSAFKKTVNTYRWFFAFLTSKINNQ